MKTYEQFIKRVLETNSMKSFSEEQLKGHYEGLCEMLRLLTKFVSFCNKYNLRYFATGGTLLGSVREGGFIPHDGDVDIALVDEDFDFFYRNFPHLHDNMWLYNSDTAKDEIDNVYINHYKRGNMTNKDISSDGKSYIGVITRLVSLNYAYDPWIQHTRGKYAYKKAMHGGVKIGIAKFKKVKNHYIPVWPVGEWDTWKKKKFKLKEEDLFPLKKSKFEDIEINIPNHEDVWLKTSWGIDYMKPLQNGYPHEYPKLGKISKLNVECLPPMYEKYYKHLYQ